MHKCPSSSPSTSTLLWMAVPCLTRISIHSIILLLSTINHLPLLFTTLRYLISRFLFHLDSLFNLCCGRCLLIVCCLCMSLHRKREFTNLRLQTSFIKQLLVGEVITRSAAVLYNTTIYIQFYTNRCIKYTKMKFNRYRVGITSDSWTVGNQQQN